MRVPPPAANAPSDDVNVPDSECIAVSKEAAAGDEERAHPRRTAGAGMTDIPGEIARKYQSRSLFGPSHVGDFRTDADARCQVDARGTAEHRVLDRRVVGESGVTGKDF